MKISIIVFLIVSLISCEASKENYRIVGKINKTDGMVYLKNFENKIIVDSSKIVNGVFEISGEIETSDYYRMTVEGSPYMNGFFLEPGETIIELNEGGSDYFFKVKGGELSQRWKEYEEIFNSRAKLIHELRKNIELKDVNEEIYVEKYDSLYKEIYDEIDGFIKINKNSIVGAYSILFSKNDLLSLKQSYQILTDKVRKTKGGGRIKRKILELEKMKKVGDEFPNFVLNNILNESIEIDSLIDDNDIVLVDFWASWCSPCRAQNPALISLYKTNRERNFKIIGISIDTKESSWLKAIEKDKLPWVQLIDTSKIVLNDLRLKSIPSNFIIDSTRKILALNVEVDDMQMKLDSIIMSKKK